MSNEILDSPAKSTFVTALAWIFIVLAGFATMISILQNVMVSVMFPVAEMRATADRAATEERMPWLVAFMLQNVRAFVFAFLVVCVTTLATSIGLLMRRNWARIMFIALMIFAILWNIAGVAFSIVFVSLIPPIPATAPQGFDQQFDLISKFIVGFNVVLAVGLGALFGWIVKRLISYEIRREFSAA